MARTLLPARPAQGQPAAPAGKGRRRTRRRPLRFWYLPLLLAILLPVLLWAGLNLGFVVFAARDLGVNPAPARAAPTVGPDQPLLEAAIALVQQAPCGPPTGAIQSQPSYAQGRWTARRSEADPHAYYVAVVDRETERLLGIWQVEGGQIQRLHDARCTALPAGPPSRLAEAAVLFSPHHPGSGG